MQFSIGGPGGPPRGRTRAARPTLYRRFLAAGTAAALTLLTGFAASPATAAPAAAESKVDKEVLAQLAAKGSTRFLVYLKDKADLSAAATRSDKGARAGYVYQQLTTVAERSQRDLTRLLTDNKIEHQSFWIANALAVTGDKALVETIAKRPEVTGIAPVRSLPLILPTEKAPANGINAAEWGLANIEAPRVWSEFGTRGEGIVIANIDSGVQFNHPALVNQYRGNLGGGTFDHNYNWTDPSRICGTPSLAPCDNNDHGTHTMGTMVGDDGAGNQIGVAPAARWIAAKGCEGDTCTSTALLASGQWVIAPTDLTGANPRPDRRPDIVNNSWGGRHGDPWYRDTVRAWVAAGIMPVFATGNSGPACGTANSPGDYPESYAVGGYDINNAVYNRSSRGTSGVDDAVKPNIAGPAVNVRSSTTGSAYQAFTGTSMAAPHVAGTVALLWSASPTTRSDITATRTLLGDTAIDVDSLGCGGTVDFNNDFGEGRLNAYQAVLAAPRGATGRVVGVVTDATTSRAIQGASVTAGTVAATTGPDGRYTLTLPFGEHTVTAAKYGYASRSAAVTVVEGSVTRDFALTAQPTVTVSGRVVDGSGHNWPLYARLDVAGREGPPVYTNPETGAYSFSAPGNATYRVSVTALYPGYQQKTEEIVVGSGNVTRNIAVPIVAGCTAPGYRVNVSQPKLSQSFDAPETPTDWTVVKRNPGGAAWAFNDPGGRTNLTGGSGAFAIADSDIAGSATTTDTDLITPTLDLTGVTNPTLRFNSDFRDIGEEDFTDIDVSTDGGTTWSTVWHQTASRRGPVVEEVPLTPAAGKSNVKVRFHYFGTWDWWWQVDNVTIANHSCDPVPGGLVVGFTTDATTGTPVTAATVTSRDNPADKGVSVDTPNDPNIGDGFYSLFSSLTGAHPFSAEKARYETVTKPVTVIADSVARADFALRSGRLTITPPKIESFQTLGQTRSTTVTVRNTGTAATTVELFERGGDFTLLNRRGAPLQMVQVPGGVPQDMMRKGQPANVRASGPVIDESWRQIDDAPAAISDNAAAWVNGKVYSVGGGTGTGNETKAFVYDPTTEDWATLPDAPRARSKPQAAALNGKLYVFGGWGTGGTPQAAVDVFDPATGSWSTLAATNPKPAAAAGVTVVKGKVYLVGGCLTGTCANSADTVQFDPAGESFSIVAAYPHPVAWMACGGIADRAYCAGGTAAAAPFTDGYSYDPAANAWTPIATMPVDLWGSQEATAGGLLVLAGGVTGGALTNRTIAYDPASNSWRDLPNANFARARGAGACGTYKIGGWDGPFSPTRQSELLPGADSCQDAADVPWLSENPATFTLAPGASRTVTVTLAATAAAGVHQPGDYRAEIAVRADTPHPVGTVGVTMHVLPPATWGKITGTVQGQSCTGGLRPVSAQIQLYSVANPDLSYSLTAGRDGTYAIWLPRGRYDLIVAKDAWAPQVRRHQVQAGFVDTIDFTLRPFGGCNNSLGGV